MISKAAAPLLLSFALLLAAPAIHAQGAGSTADLARLVRIDLDETSLELTDPRMAHLDVVLVEPGTRLIEVVAHDRDLRLLEELEVPYVIVHEDLVSFYASRLEQDPSRAPLPGFGAWLSPPFGQGSMGGYYTASEIASVLDQIAAAYPALVTPKFSIGLSHEGRPLWAIKVSDNPGVDESEPEVRFDALHHAREPEGMQILLWGALSLLESYGTDPLATWIVDHREIWFLPLVNPDGYSYNEQNYPGGGGMWRKNRRDNGGGIYGVDLNRNYPYEWGYDDIGSSPNPSYDDYRGPSAASEPETFAMTSFITARSFSTVLSIHCHGNYWLTPWGYDSLQPTNQADYDEIGTLVTEVNGYPYGPPYVLLSYFANGGTMDYDHGEHGTMAWSPEIGTSSDGFWPPTSRIIPLAEENELALWRTALAAGAWVHTDMIAMTEVGDGDGYFEAGESAEIRVAVRNSGRVASTTPVSLTLSSASPDLTLGTTNVSLGVLASFSGANNDSTPLTFAIDSGASGAVVDFTVSIAWDGASEDDVTTFVVGEPRPFLVDTVETDLGWIAGLPGDTATTGIWEFGDPVGTSSGGEPSNPEDDATPTGVACFATGNGSTTAGGDDVDDGFTTLVSPAIDLSSVSAAVISYSRWYADLSTADDVFEVSISDDDGATWQPLETVSATANSWTEVSFVVNGIVSLTDQVRLRFVAEDDPNNSVVEAGVDDLEVEVFTADPRLVIYGRPTIGDPLAFHVSGDAGDPYSVYLSQGTADISFPFLVGNILLHPSTLSRLYGGTVPAAGLGRSVISSPNDPTLVGQTIYFQAFIVHGGQFVLTNRDQLTFE